MEDNATIDAMVTNPSNTNIVKRFQMKDLQTSSPIYSMILNMDFYVKPIIATVGVTGSLLILVVCLLKENRSKVSSMYMISLAAGDLLESLTRIIRTVLFIYVQFGKL